ncbi:unnamed protein product [Protopolystoma xenopodis]|uniref:Uncharacterized protein n=1 Tax=Protopolystoma xenopodis TaxID=117903 RepID=A0A448X1S7_9PLAT|nr:unnamed protein product [Protopolystoma xenopodis]
MVIRDKVAAEVENAVIAWQTSTSQLAVGSNCQLHMAFSAARRALYAADTAFFDHTLLELLYFQCAFR